MYVSWSVSDWDLRSRLLRNSRLATSLEMPSPTRSPLSRGEKGSAFVSEEAQAKQQDSGLVSHQGIHHTFNRKQKWGSTKPYPVGFVNRAIQEANFTKRNLGEANFPPLLHSLPSPPQSAVLPRPSLLQQQLNSPVSKPCLGNGRAKIKDSLVGRVI